MSADPIFQQRMFPIDANFDDDMLRTRSNQLMKDFLALHPDLRRLSSCRLVYRSKVKCDGVYFQLYREAIPQRQLPFSASKRGHAPISLEDLDSTRINASQLKVKELIVQALDPTATPDRVRSEFSKQHLAVRALMLRRGTTLLDTEPLFNSAQLRNVFSLATKAQLMIQVVQIRRRCAMVRICEPLHSDIDPRQSVLIGRMVPLYLPRLSEELGIYLTLLDHLDRDKPLRINVGIGWRAKDGQIAFLEYLPP
jgi:hypothetical protein